MPEAEDCPKNWPRSFEDNCEILRTIFQPRVLSSHIPTSQERVYLFYNPDSLISTTRKLKCCGKEKTFSKGHSTFAAKKIPAG